MDGVRVRPSAGRARTPCCPAGAYPGRASAWRPPGSCGPSPPRHVLVLTTYDTDADVIRAVEATVTTHPRRIHDKLGVGTRAGAVAVAKEQRLLP